MNEKKTTPTFSFRDFFRKQSVLIISEFANAFEGKKDTAIEMIDKAVGAGVDALKFQLFFADELLTPSHPKYDLFKSIETRPEDWHQVLSHAAGTGTLIFADIYGDDSYRLTRNHPIDAVKIPPTEMGNYPLIKTICADQWPMILSAGASSYQNIQDVIDICLENGVSDYAIMSGFQNYPTKLEDTNLNLIEILSNRFHCPVGYADHVSGDSDLAILLPVLAVAKGAMLIEKHFTLNRSQKGIDYQSSVEPDDLKRMVQLIRTTDVVFGSKEKKLSKDESSYKKDIRKRIVAKRELEVGEAVNEKNFSLKRADRGMFAEDYEKVVGLRLKKRLAINEPLDWDSLDAAPPKDLNNQSNEQA